MALGELGIIIGSGVLGLTFACCIVRFVLSPLADAVDRWLDRHSCAASLGWSQAERDALRAWQVEGIYTDVLRNHRHPLRERAELVDAYRAERRNRKAYRDSDRDL